MAQNKLLDLNENLDDQTSRIKLMSRTANETQETTNNIMRELGDQGEKINRQIDIVHLTLRRTKISRPV